MIHRKRRAKVLSLFLSLLLLLAAFSDTGAVFAAEQVSEQDTEVTQTTEAVAETAPVTQPETPSAAAEPTSGTEAQTAGDGAETGSAGANEATPANETSTEAQTAQQNQAENQTQGEVPAQTDVTGASADEENPEEQTQETQTETGAPAEEVLTEETMEEELQEAEPEPLRAPESTSTDLKEFLTEVTCSASTDASGNYVINGKDSYTLFMKFAESEGKQFANDAALTYTFPAGMNISNIPTTSFDINIRDSQGPAAVSGNTFEINGGVLTVRFNQNDPNYERLTAVSNVSFRIEVSATFNEGVGKIDFGSGIEKDFVFETKNDLEIEKTVVYDATTDTASYELTVKSTGTNHNVKIQDTLKGAALILNQDVTVTSSKTGALSASIDYSSISNGFALTIPEMTDEEVLTIRYTAQVDNDKITESAKVSDTNNTARVVSEELPDGKEVERDFSSQIKFHRVSKEAVGTPAQDSGNSNHYLQDWKIEVNKDHKWTMGGTMIRDSIADKDRSYMSFTGTGITVQVTMEDGSEQTRQVPWNGDGMRVYYVNSDASRPMIRWEYTPPVSDGKASYEITYQTLIDTTNAQGTLEPTNSAQVKNTYRDASTKIEGVGESTFSLEKHATLDTTKESGWELVVHVDGTGYAFLRVVDDLPKETYNGQTYLDELQLQGNLESSVTVTGLLPGEAWSISRSSDQRSVTITFYQDTAKTIPGIQPTADGNSRDIKISFKTNVNQEWLTIADDLGYADHAWHTNSASASAPGLYKQANDHTYPKKESFKKEVVRRETVQIDGVDYPVYRYALTLTNPIDDTAEISDTFDTRYLKYYAAGGITIRGGSAGALNNTDGTVSAQDSADGISIRVEKFPTNGSGDKYPVYQIEYSLIVKDKDALDALNEAALGTAGYTLENTATWNGLTSETVEVIYTYDPYVDKELITQASGANDYVAEFKLIINKNAEDLDPNSDTLNIQDELSPNLRYLPDSLTIKPGDTTLRSSYDSETNSLTFLDVPDGTRFEISYQARVLGKGETTYSNTVKFGTYEKTVEDTITISSSGAGSGSNPSITLVKRDAEDMSLTLAGATFQLYYMSGGTQVPVRGTDGNIATFTTGSDGRVLISGNQATLGWTLWADREYVLVETQAPAGYERNADPIHFTLSETPSNQMEYNIAGDQVDVQDQRIKTELPVRKEWVGPAAGDVTVHLLAGTEDTGKTLTLNESNNWFGKFTDLDKYDLDGAEITYSVREDPIDHYSPSYDITDAGEVLITNRNTETVDIPVKKTWIGPAAGPVTVNLLRDNADTGITIELTEAGNWQGAFTGLAKYDPTDGHEYLYEVKEDDIENYEPRINDTEEGGFVITNSNVETIDIPVTKIWIGPAAGPVTVNLLRDNADTGITIELTEAGSWQGAFTGLAKYDPTDGHEYKYEVKEDDIENYEPRIDDTEEGGYTITNTNVETIDIPVKKTWIGPAAGPVTVNLLRDNADTGITIELTEAGSWQGAFTGLAKYDPTDGHEYLYEVKEDDIENYEPRIDDTEEGGYTITNTNVETIDIPVKKTWIGPAAGPVTVNLLRDNADTGITIELTEAGNWQGAFTGLAKYDPADGHEYKYEVKEDDIENYEPRINDTEEGGFVITNTNVETIDIPVKKTWIGPAAGPVTVNLLRDNEDTGITIELTEAGNWQGAFTGLAKYDPADGHEYKYAVKEDAVTNYTPRITGTVTEGYTITNTNVETIDIPVKKIWVGQPLSSVTVNLLADGVKAQEAVLNAAGNWQHSFTGLAKYDASDGHEIVYTVSESAAAGYVTGISGTAASGFTVTNTITGKVSVPVTKAWAGPAAKQVTVNLLADGVKAGTVVLSSANNWQYTFTNLEQYESGKEIRYTVEEEDLSGYSTQISGTASSGYIITNTNTETIDIPVKKTWVGAEADRVTIRLYADNDEVQKAVLSKATSWGYTFSDLPKYDAEDGHRISYSISEDSLDGYETEIKGSAEKGFTVTNTRKDPKTTPNTNPPTSSGKAGSPKTGDETHLTELFFLLLASGCILIFLLYRKKRNQRSL